MKPVYPPQRILLLGLLGINFMVLVLSVYALIMNRQQYELRAQTLTQNIASAVDQNVSSTIEKIDVALGSVVKIIKNQYIKNVDKQDVNELLNLLVKRMPEVEGIRVINRDGLIILGNGVTKAVSVSDRDHFIYHRDNANEALRISKPLWGRIVNHYILVFSHRYNDPDGSFAGVVYATVTLDHFNKLLSRYNLGPDGAIILRNSDLGLLARHPDISPKPVGMVGNTAVSRELRQLAESGLRLATYHTPTSADGFERTFSFRRLDESPFIVLVGLASKDYLADWYKEVYVVIAINLSFLLLTLLSGYTLQKSFKAVQTSAERMNEAQRIAHVGSWTWDIKSGMLSLSDEIFRLLEIDPDQFDGTYEAFIKFIHHEDLDAVNSSFAESLTQLTGFEINHRLLMSDGRIKWIQQRVTSDFDSEGKPLSYHGTFLDITERKRTDDRLRITANVFDISQEAIMITDADNNIIEVNPAFSDITHYNREDVIGKNPKFLSSGRHDKVFYDEMWQSLNQKRAWRGEIWNRRKSGEIYPEMLSISVLCNDDGNVLRFVAVFSDISNIKEREDELSREAHYDTLTGIPNRRLLMDRLGQALASSARNGRRGGLMFIDLDNFKLLNDSLGHDMGDLLLKQVARRLESLIREEDTVARLGGDEFVIVLEDLSANLLEAAAKVDLVAKKILEALNKPYQLASYEFHNTPSIGITVFNGHEFDIENLFKQADIAMYQSKKFGRNTIRFFDPKMQDAVDTFGNI